MNNKAILSKGGTLNKLKVQAILILLVSACVLPFLVHLLPSYNGIPMGAFLLPMFYIPFIAIVFYRLHAGLIIAALAPLINFLVSGRPDWQFVTILTFELIVFSLFVFLLLQTNWQIIAAPLAYLLTKIVSSLLLFIIPIMPVSPFDFFTNSITNAAPGIIVLLSINWFLIKNGRNEIN